MYSNPLFQRYLFSRPIRKIASLSEIIITENDYFLLDKRDVLDNLFHLCSKKNLYREDCRDLYRLLNQKGYEYLTEFNFERSSPHLQSFQPIPYSFDFPLKAHLLVLLRSGNHVRLVAIDYQPKTTSQSVLKQYCFWQMGISYLRYPSAKMEKDLQKIEDGALIPPRMISDLSLENLLSRFCETYKKSHIALLKNQKRFPSYRN